MIEKVKLKFIRSYLLVIMVVVLLLGGILTASLVVMRKDSIHKNEVMLEYVQRNLDNTFSSLYTTAYEISSRKPLVAPSDTISMKDAVSISNYVQSFQNIHGTMHSIAIYFPEQQLVIDQSGQYLPRHYCLLNDRRDVPLEEKLDQLASPHTMELQIWQTGSHYELAFYHTLWQDEQGCGPLLMMTISEDALVKQLHNAKLDNSEAFAITDRNGHILASVGNQALLLEMEKFPSAGDLVILKADSHYGGLRYLSLSQSSTFDKTFHTICVVMFIGVILVTVVGILCALWLGRRNIQPLHSISQMLAVIDRQEPLSERKDLDFYTYVEDHIDKLQKDRTLTRQQLSNQQRMLRQIFTSSLLRGQLVEENQFVERCTAMGIDFADKLHCAFVLYPTAGKLPEPQDLVLEELLRSLDGLGQCSAELVQLDDQLLGWLLLPDVADAEDRCREYLDTLTLQLQQQYHVQAIAVTGRICESFQLLPASCREAIWALHMVMTRNKKGNFIWQDTQLAGVSDYIQRNLDIYSAFVDHLRTKNYEGALAQLEPMVAFYLNAELPNQYYMLHRQAVQAVLVDALDQAAGQDHSHALQIEECREKLFTMKSGRHFGEVLRTSIELLLETSDAGKSDPGHNIDQIRSYVEQNFTNPDMGLVLLAEQFSMSTSYLSRYFKSELGTGLLDFVNRLRMEKARKLLRDSHDTNIQIAQAVGYSSDVVFSRVFKRYEGITPGKYREMVRNTV